MFERLLLAIDDSPASELATLFANAAARRTGAAVRVLHVNEYLVGGRGVTLLTHDESDALVDGAVKELHDAGVPADGVSVVATYRQVPQCIVEAARDYEADAIVLGSNRHRWMSRLFSPQVRERTTRLTSLPILTAPAPLRVTAEGMRHAVQAQVDAEIASFRG
jgi:nucleotide-binding universal stress UspA family protein